MVRFSASFPQKTEVQACDRARRLFPSPRSSAQAAAQAYGQPEAKQPRLVAGDSSRDSTRRRSPGGGSTCIMSRPRVDRAIKRRFVRPAQEESLFIGVSKRGEFFLQHAPGFRDAPFDRAERRSEHLADLFVGVFAGAGEQQRVAELFRQRPMSRVTFRCSSSSRAVSSCERLVEAIRPI